MITRSTSFLLAAAFVLGGMASASAQLTIPSDGSDGALNITGNTVIDLSQAPDGTWNQNNTANAGKGVYDPDKWAVVFKYSSVNIASGATVTFTNHRTYAPVVWLVSGNVTINGTVNLSGQDGVNTLPEGLTPRKPGPGGFRGGVFGPGGYGAGYGPKGGERSEFSSLTIGKYVGFYGNPQIIPLIGGSGAGAHNNSDTGAGGGGAILIAASGTVSIGGGIVARGGAAIRDDGGASGGAVRIIATSVTGAGNINATGGRTSGSDNPGRIRIEADSLAPSLVTAPETIRVAPANPPVIWPAANAPKVRVASVDSASAPLDPTAPLIADADVAIQNNNPVNIILETKDFPIEGVVELHIIPKFGNRTKLAATRVSGSITQATWRVTTTLPQGFVTLQARATQP